MGIVKAGLGWIASKILSPVADLAMAPLNAIAKGIATGVGAVLKVLADAWIHLSTPDVWNGSTSAIVDSLHNQVAYLAALLAVLGIIVGGIKLALQQRNEPGFDVVHGLVVLVLVAGVGVPTIGLLASASDAWADAIVSHGGNSTDFGRNILLLVSPGGPVAPVLLIIFGFFALMASVAQVMLLAFRAAVLVLSAGLITMSASATTTSGGQQQFRRVVGWILACVAYKPLAALIYVTGFRLTGTHQLSGGGVGDMIIGLTMMVCALLALPALIRLIVPAITAASDHAASRPITSAAPTGAVVIRTITKVI